MNTSLNKFLKPLLLGLGVALYLKFLLIPTAMLFYELHHATGIDFIYWGYSGFKVAGYYFGVWEYQTLSCIALGLQLFMFVLWRGGKNSLENET